MRHFRGKSRFCVSTLSTLFSYICRLENVPQNYNLFLYLGLRNGVVIAALNLGKCKECIH